MEYVLGPVIALLLGMKFTDFKSKKTDKAIQALESRVEVVELSVKAVEDQQNTIEEQMPKKMMATLLPVAKAVQKLNTQVGIK